MNQKITIKTEAGEISYFIVDPDQAIDQQLAILHGREIGHGITYRLTETQVQMVDYFCDSVIGAHEILSIEDTDEAVSLRWNPIKA